MGPGESVSLLPQLHLLESGTPPSLEGSGFLGITHLPKEESPGLPPPPRTPLKKKELHFSGPCRASSSEADTPPPPPPGTGVAGILSQVQYLALSLNSQKMCKILSTF